MGSADAKAFQGWAEKNALNYNPVPYQDRGDLLAALRAGDIDLAATSYVGDTQKFPAIAKFAPQLMYFAITPAKPQLAAQLNQAMSNILLYNASFPDALEKVTKPDKGLYPVLVSEKEKELIRNLPPLRVALSVHDAPFSYEHDGELRGIAIRVLDRIAELTGLQFTYVPAENAADARALLANGEADMASGMAVNHIKAQEQDFRMTTPYYQDHMAYLIRRGHEAQHIAVSAEIAPLVEEMFPEKDYTETSTAQEASRLLEDGKVDALVTDMATASYTMGRLHRSDYELKIAPDIPSHIAFALPRSADPQLGFLLDRTIQYLVETEMDEIEQSAIDQAPLSFSNLLDRLTGTQVNVLLFILVLVIGLLIYFLWSVRHRSRLDLRVAAIEREHDSTTASLALEKKIGHAQQDFLRYMDDNIMEPVQESLRHLIHLGAADPKSPLHKEYTQCGQVEDFMMEIRLLNDLVQDNFEMGDWQETRLSTILTHLSDVFAQASARMQVHFTRDFSGIGDEKALLEPRAFTMLVMRVLNYLLLATPDGGSIAFSASISLMTGTKHPRCVLWLMFHAPDVKISPSLQRLLPAMHESVQKNPRNIYENMTKFPRDATESRYLLIRLAILELLVLKLGGEWQIEYTKAGGTELTVNLLLDCDPT